MPSYDKTKKNVCMVFMTISVKHKRQVNLKKNVLVLTHCIISMLHSSRCVIPTEEVNNREKM